MFGINKKEIKPQPDYVSRKDFEDDEMLIYERIEANSKYCRNLNDNFKRYDEIISSLRFQIDELKQREADRDMHKLLKKLKKQAGFDTLWHLGDGPKGGFRAHVGIHDINFKSIAEIEAYIKGKNSLS